MNRYAEIIGYMVMVAGGFAIAATLLAICAYLLNVVGWKVFKRLKEIYKLATIRYWLGRMDESGFYVLRDHLKETVEKHSAAAPEAKP